MKNSFFAMVSRMRYINRWSLMRNTRNENIEEHSLQVAIIAHAIALIRIKFFNFDENGNSKIKVDPQRVAVLAIYHDTDEILVGDMPTPVKYFNKDIEKVFKSIEKEATNKLLNMLPDELKEDYLPLLSPDTTDPETLEAMKIVKAADKISALIKCIEEDKAGNNEFIPASRKIRETIEKMNLPEIKYFMDNFIPPFALTLDELENS